MRRLSSVADASLRAMCAFGLATETLRHITYQPPTAHRVTLPGSVRLQLHEPVAASPLLAAEAIADPLRAPASATLALAPAACPVGARGVNAPFARVHPRALIRTTKGDIVLRLYPEWAPGTIANFLGLGTRGYYDGNRRFRIVPMSSCRRATRTTTPTVTPAARFWPKGNLLNSARASSPWASITKTPDLETRRGRNAISPFRRNCTLIAISPSSVKSN